MLLAIQGVEADEEAAVNGDYDDRKVYEALRARGGRRGNKLYSLSVLQHIILPVRSHLAKK